MIEDVFEYLANISVMQFAGICGFFCYALSFALLQFRVIGGNGIAYPAMNVAAAVLVMVSLIENFNLASLLIQIFFMTVGMIGICAMILRRHRP